MFDIITALSTNLFRTYLIKKFMSLFFKTDIGHKGKRIAAYSLFYLLTAAVYLFFHHPLLNILTNIIMVYFIAQLYESDQKKKILVTLLIYGINMICDILAIYSFSNYIVGEEYNELAAYATVFLISICEFIIERFAIKNNEIITPPNWNILITIPIISIIILFILLMSNLNNRIVLVSVSAGILFINMLIFYLYNAMADLYLRLEENTLLERQMISYSNQLDVLMQSEEKVNALRHDMKHHLNELIVMAEQCGEWKIKDYLCDMQRFMDNSCAYVQSDNKEIDSLLNYMLKKANQILDKVECKVNIPKSLSIRPFDLNVILGNLLDNAIFAAGNSQDKWLSVILSYEKGMLFINIKNSYNNKIIKQNQEYVTTKRAGKEHGIGLQNVKKVVYNYNGRMEIGEDNNIFDVKVMMYTILMK